MNVTLPEERAAKLARLAERTPVQPGAPAGSLLAHAIDEDDPDAARIVALLDRIPGSWDPIDPGIADVRADRTIPFGADR